jgi:glycosyltransferase involved in cell wall biosynthesis
VGYSGNFGRAHEFDAIMDAMTRLEAGRLNAAAPGIRFLFIGGGALHERLRKEISQRRLGNVLIQPYQPRERLSESLSVPDVHLVSLRPELEGLVVPSKLYGILAAARPVLFIGDPEGEVAHLVRTERCGFTACPGDGEILARHIVKLAGDPALRHAMGQRARALFEARFERALAIERWECLLGNFSSRQPSSPAPAQ